MTHLLDTDTCIDILRGREEVIDAIRSYAPDELGVSVITTYELFYGVERCAVRRIASEKKKVELFLDALHVLPFTLSTGRYASKIRAKLEFSGNPVGPMDTLIAAQAMEADLALITGNLREFSRIDGLRIAPSREKSRTGK